MKLRRQLVLFPSHISLSFFWILCYPQFPHYIVFLKKIHTLLLSLPTQSPDHRGGCLLVVIFVDLTSWSSQWLLVASLLYRSNLQIQRRLVAGNYGCTIYLVPRILLNNFRIDIFYLNFSLCYLVSDLGICSFNLLTRACLQKAIA